MILQLFTVLLSLSILSLLFKKRRYLRIFEFCFFVTMGFLCFYIWNNPLSKQISQDLIPWLPYEGFKANLNLSSSAELWSLMFILTGMATFVLGFNFMLHTEKRYSPFFSIVFMNLAFAILLYNSQDFLQLMAGSFGMTLLSFYGIENAQIRTKSLYYGFFTEMCLFSALAIVFSRLDNINLSSLQGFSQKGYHRDLIAILVLLTVFGKAGLILFQNKLLDMKKLPFSRIMNICFLGNIIGSVILFVKLQPLWQASKLSEIIIPAMLGLSLFWGFFGALIIDNIKAKALYLNLMLYSLVFMLLYHNGGHWDERVFYLFPLGMLLNFLLAIPVIFASNEVYVSEMGGFAKYMKRNYLLTIFACLCWMVFLNQIRPQGEENYIYIYEGLVLTALAHILYRIYWGKENSGAYVIALLTNMSTPIWAILMLGLGFGLWQCGTETPLLIYGLYGLWLVLSCLGIFRFLEPLDEMEIIQDTDFFKGLYHYVIVAPISLLGRILWLSIDFLIIERSVIGGISEMTTLAIRGLQRIQNTTWLNYLFMLLVGLAIILLGIGNCHD